MKLIVSRVACLASAFVPHRLALAVLDRLFGPEDRTPYESRTGTR